jgi:hypothetical protein
MYLLFEYKSAKNANYRDKLSSTLYSTLSPVKKQKLGKLDERRNQISPLKHAF